MKARSKNAPDSSGNTVVNDAAAKSRKRNKGKQAESSKRGKDKNSRQVRKKNTLGRHLQ